MEQTILTNMCMVYQRETGRVVIQHRPGHWKGCAYPGGHIEAGEAFVPAVIREVWEETGLIIEKPILCGIKHWYRPGGIRYIVFLYATDRFTGELVDGTREGRVEWVKLEDVPNMMLADTFLPMAQIMAEGLGVPFPNEHPGCHEYYFDHFEGREGVEGVNRFY